MKLISMTDFVLEQTAKEFSAIKRLNQIIGFAEFLKQPLKLEMFVPCDGEGNILEQPVYTTSHSDECYCKGCEEETKRCSDLQNQYQKAKEKVLFEGFGVKYFDLRKKSYLIFNNDFVLDLTFKHKKYIESLIHLNIELTPTAIKQIRLSCAQ